MISYPGAILAFLAAFQLLFVALYLFFHKQGNKRNNRLLGLVFLLIAISMADASIRLMGIEVSVPVLHLFDDGFLFLYGPLLYFYTKGVVYRDFKFKTKHLLHLIPYVLFLTYLITGILSLDQVAQAEATRQIVAADIPTWMILVSMSLYMYLFVYLWFCNQLIAVYSAALKDNFSSLDKINLDWLSFIIRSFAAITLIAMINNVIPILGSTLSLYASMVLLLVFTFYFINSVLLKALNQSEIFSGISSKSQEKYAGSSLKPQEIESLRLQLQELLEKEKLYLNTELTLKDLADRLLVSTKVLSQVINQSFDQFFFDLINSYRCEEVKSILSGADDKITISEAMYRSGFNSKSSFNKEFKKLTGQSPSEYKKSLLK